MEIVTGDLEGKGSQDSYRIWKEFSQDGRNLLLKEEHQNGKVVCYSYLTNTNLVTSKITKDRETTLLREFFLYDDCHNLIQEISDDGISASHNDLSGVTQRTITNTILRQEAPFLHMPEWIEEKYLENGSEKLLTKKHLIYDNHGNIAQEELYDANNCLAYTLFKEYNERGDLVSETDPYLQKASYDYDKKGNCTSAINFSRRLTTLKNYDRRNRLIQKNEIADDSASHTTLYEYDFQDRLIKKIDPFQNTTQYTYDPLISQITKTDFPSVATLENQSSPVTTHSTYDSFGREITSTDANGNSKTYRYNAYGSPTELIYPDGGIERFLYEKEGTLASYTDQEGLTTIYKRDVLGRILSQTYISNAGETLAQETFTYNGFHLITSTDKEGNVTTYTYDGAGRTIKEDSAGHVTEFCYDALNRLTTVVAYNGDNTLVTHYKKDFDDRLLETCKTDTAGQILYKISYTYDNDGNTASIKRTINAQESIESLTYDSFKRLTGHKDALGFVTTHKYCENHLNSLGQKVLQEITINPQNITTIATRDAFNRLVKKEIINPQGSILQSEEQFVRSPWQSAL